MSYDVLTIFQFIQALYAGQIDGQARGDGRLWIESYGYPLDFLNFASASGNATQSLSINANADFLLTEIDYFATLALPAATTVGTKVVAQVQVQITDAGSARPFFAGPVALENVAQNGDPRRLMPFPRWLAANSSITVSVLGIGPAETLDIYLFFKGMSVRRYSPAINPV